MKHESFGALPFALLCKVLLIVDTLSERLLIHEYNYSVFFISLLMMPILIYLVKTIPLKYAVYEVATMQKLDKYSYRLERLKLSYNKLSREMSNAAVLSSGQETVKNVANDLVSSIMSGNIPSMA